MLRRRLFAVTAAVATVTTIAITASGCSGVSGPAPKQDAKASLEVWVREPPDAGGELVKAIGTAFTKKTGIPVKTVSIPEGFETKLQQAAAQHDLPDIVINDNDQLGHFAAQGLVREVDRPGIDRQVTITDRTWEAAKSHGGTYYGVPFSSQSQAFLVRKDWREKLRQPVPRTWADIEALAKAFTQGDPNGDGKPDTYGIEAPLSSKRGYASWFFATFLWSWGGDFVKESGGKFSSAVTTPASVAAFTRFRDLACKDKVIQPGAATADTTATLESFQAGKTGIYLTGPYVMARIDQRLGRDKYEVVPVPKGEGDRAVTLAEGENIYLMSGSANQQGQTQYAVFAASPQAQQIGLGVGAAKPVVRLPVNGDINAAAIRKDPRWDVFDKAHVESGRYFPRVPNWTPIRQATADTVNALVADCRLNVNQQLGNLHQRLTAELRGQQVLAG